MNSDLGQIDKNNVRLDLSNRNGEYSYLELYKNGNNLCYRSDPNSEGLERVDEFINKLNNYKNLLENLLGK